MPLELSQYQAHVWTVSLQPPPSRLRECEAQLSEEELVRAGRFIHKRDRERYIISHGALRSVLAEYCRVPAQKLVFETNRFGKPRLTHFPDIQFSLSHSHDLALIALRRDVEIGVDVEYVRDDVGDGVAERFFSPGELERLRTLQGAERVLGFFRCWTRKEAYLKALGRGISDADLAQVEVTLLPGEEPRIVRSARGPGESGAWSLFHLSPAPGYVAALATLGRDVKLTSREWR